MNVLTAEKTIGNLYADFVHAVVMDMRQISTSISVPVCRLIAKNILHTYPKSFGVLDKKGRLVDVDAITLTTSIVNRNNYINRLNIQQTEPSPKLQVSQRKKISILKQGVANFSDNPKSTDENDKAEQSRIWLKNHFGLTNINKSDLDKTKQLLDDTYFLQRQYINNPDSPPTVLQISNEWPHLLKKTYLIDHFNKLTEHETEFFYENYNQACKTILELVEKSSKFKKIETETTNEQLMVLFHIIGYFDEKREFLYKHFKVFYKFNLLINQS